MRIIIPCPPVANRDPSGCTSTEKIGFPEINQKSKFFSATRKPVPQFK